jgi:hypothetical protein
MSSGSGIYVKVGGIYVILKWKRIAHQKALPVNEKSLARSIKHLINFRAVLLL